MDDGEVELSDHVLVQNWDSCSSVQPSHSVDSFLDGLLRNSQTCTHTHTCNLAGPDDAAHTHTCYHTHTCVFSSEKDGVSTDKTKLESKTRRPSGNREAVRKYREKKKAHTAYLEEEVRKLRSVNQLLVRKLHRQALLEEEVLRLRRLLLDLRGKIDDELGVIPFQKKCNFKEGDCENGLQCFNPRLDSCMQGNTIGGFEKMVVSWDGNCQPPIVDCRASGNDIAIKVKTMLDSVTELPKE